MERNLSTDYNDSKNEDIIKWAEKLFCLIRDENLEIGEALHFDSYLNDLRIKDNYPLFLNYILNQNNNKLVQAMALFLSQKEFICIKECEEKFIIDILHLSNLDLQDYALNAITLWGEVSNKDTLKDVIIKNRYLQEELEAFLA